jgi:hypothetical protein
VPDHCLLRTKGTGQALQACGSVWHPSPQKRLDKASTKRGLRMRLLCETMLLLTLSGACAPAPNPPTPLAPICPSVAQTTDTVILAHAGAGLVGEYNLVAAVDTGRAAGRMGTGRLTIWRAADGRILAATALDLPRLEAPIMGNLAGWSDSRPGLRLQGRTLVLSEMDDQPSTVTAFAIDQISDTGFAGHWHSRSDRFIEFRNGEAVTDAAGHFCAERQ